MGLLEMQFLVWMCEHGLSFDKNGFQAVYALNKTVPRRRDTGKEEKSLDHISGNS